MRAIDASSIIYAWDNYPADQFPPMWGWIAEEVREGRLLIASVAFREVRDKTPECARWLTDCGISILDIGNAELNEAMRIKQLIGVQGDNYHPKGVGENDLLIISASRLRNFILISDEERQPNLPNVPSKMKIPAVCGLEEVRVECINFLTYLKQSGRVFG